MSKRPEHENPPDIYYDDENAKKYHVNSRIRNIQRKLTERAIELLQLPADQPCHILDLGCGTGLSGEVLAERGHSWVGMDISRSMLGIAKNREFVESDFDEDEDNEDDDDEVDDDEADDDDDQADDSAASENEEEVDQALEERKKWREVMHGDMGNGVPFRPGVFDGVISISVVQWLCNVDRKGQVPQRRLRELFQTLYNSMRRGARAVLQFYPESPQQMNMITQAAMKCGFGGGMVVDFPHSTRAKKYYLVIYAGTTGSGGYVPPKPLTENEDDEYEFTDEEYSGEEDEEEDEDEDENTRKRKIAGRVRVDGRDRRNKFAAAAADRKKRRKDNRPMTGTKEWVLLKKSQRRKFGLETKPDNKYTMRRRRPKF